MSNVFMVSDTHFFQEEIRLTDGMDSDITDNRIITTWSTTVKSDDVVFHLGDVGIDKDKLQEVFKDLPGTKILIMGNHDFIYSPKNWIDIGFQEVYRFPIIYEEFYMLSHKPQYLNKFMPYANVHGHIHLNHMITHGKTNKYINVSWPAVQDNWGIVNFNTIKHLFE